MYSIPILYTLQLMTSETPVVYYCVEGGDDDDAGVSRSIIRGGTGDRLSRAECDIIM